jgi:hypothetical protein
MEKRLRVRVPGRAGLLAAGILLTACSLLSLPVSGGSGGSGAGEGEGTPAGGSATRSLAACPQYDTRATLTFDHDIKWGLEGVGQFGIAVAGSYQLNLIQSIATYEPGAKVGIYNVSSDPLPVTVSAIGLKGCADGKGATKMRAYVSGTCIDGTLTLYIQEYYEAASVTVMCNEGKDKVEIPIPVSLMERPVVWSLPVSKLSGVPVEKPVEFSGLGGSGGMSYKLTLP